MKVLENSNIKITKNNYSQNVSLLDITKVVIVHCNIVNNDFQHDLIVLYSFVPNKSFGQLLDMSPKMLYF